MHKKTFLNGCFIILEFFAILCLIITTLIPDTTQQPIFFSLFIILESIIFFLILFNRHLYHDTKQKILIHISRLLHKTETKNSEYPWLK